MPFRFISPILTSFIIFCLGCWQNDEDQIKNVVVNEKPISYIKDLNSQQKVNNTPAQIYEDFYIIDSKNSNGDDFVSFISLKSDSFNVHIPLNTKFNEFKQTKIIGNNIIFVNNFLFHMIDLKEKKLLYTTKFEYPVLPDKIVNDDEYLYFLMNNYDQDFCKIVKIKLSSGEQTEIYQQAITSTFEFVRYFDVQFDNVTKQQNIIFTIYNDITYGIHTVKIIDSSGNEIKDYPFLSEEEPTPYSGYTYLKESKLLSLIGKTIVCTDHNKGVKLWETNIGERVSHAILVTDNFVYIYGYNMFKIDLNTGAILEISEDLVYPGSVTYFRQYDDRHIITYADIQMIHLLNEDKIIRIKALTSTTNSPCYISSTDSYVWHSYDNTFLQMFKI